VNIYSQAKTFSFGGRANRAYAQCLFIRMLTEIYGAYVACIYITCLAAVSPAWQ